jgi:hypothetical protein
VDPQGHSAARRIRSTDKSSELTGNATRDLPVWPKGGPNVLLFNLKNDKLARLTIPFN